MNNHSVTPSGSPGSITPAAPLVPAPQQEAQGAIQGVPLVHVIPNDENDGLTTPPPYTPPNSPPNQREIYQAARREEAAGRIRKMPKRSREAGEEPNDPIRKIFRDSDRDHQPPPPPPLISVNS